MYICTCSVWYCMGGWRYYICTCSVWCCIGGWRYCVYIVMWSCKIILSKIILSSYVEHDITPTSASCNETHKHKQVILSIMVFLQTSTSWKKTVMDTCVLKTQWGTLMELCIIIECKNQQFYIAYNYLIIKNICTCSGRCLHLFLTPQFIQDKFC